MNGETRCDHALVLPRRQVGDARPAGLLALGSSYSPRLPSLYTGQWLSRVSSPNTVTGSRRIRTAFPIAPLGNTVAQSDDTLSNRGTTAQCSRCSAGSFEGCDGSAAGARDGPACRSRAGRTPCHACVATLWQEVGHRDALAAERERSDGGRRRQPSDESDTASRRPLMRPARGRGTPPRRYRRGSRSSSPGRRARVETAFAGSIEVEARLRAPRRRAPGAPDAMPR